MKVSCKLLRHVIVIILIIRVRCPGALLGRGYETSSPSKTTKPKLVHHHQQQQQRQSRTHIQLLHNIQLGQQRPLMRLIFP